MLKNMYVPGWSINNHRSHSIGCKCMEMLWFLSIPCEHNMLSSCLHSKPKLQPILLLSSSLSAWLLQACPKNSQILVHGAATLGCDPTQVWQSSTECSPRHSWRSNPQEFVQVVSGKGHTMSCHEGLLMAFLSTSQLQLQHCSCTKQRFSFRTSTYTNNYKYRLYRNVSFWHDCTNPRHDKGFTFAVKTAVRGDSQLHWRPTEASHHQWLRQRRQTLQAKRNGESLPRPATKTGNNGFIAQWQKHLVRHVRHS